MPAPEAPTAEPVAVWLAGDAGHGFTVRMTDASARLLAALLAAGRAGKGTPADTA